ncbi:YceI family protein [Caulobacter sp. S45]|uniref:YceI family protein n=1 Tax=Caulobacter sp. S45 TaxID=1641861 RepID=UPI001576CC61|nr:YceI family protein [Caulobacter sp. S45]
MRKGLLAGLLALAAVLVAVAALLLRAPRKSNSLASPVAATGAARPAAVASPVQTPTATVTAGPAKHSARTATPTKAAPVWTVDKAASRLTFRAVMNGQPFDGVFRSWDAQIAFDPHNLATSRATLTVDTTSALTGQPIKDAALPNSEWLATTAFPQATMVTRLITQTGPGRYQASADVHIRGVAWRTTVPFTVVISHDDGRMQSTLTLDRRTFGIGEGPFRSPAPVDPLVQVSLRLVAKKSR